MAERLMTDFSDNNSLIAIFFINGRKFERYCFVSFCNYVSNPNAPREVIQSTSIQERHHILQLTK